MPTDVLVSGRPDVEASPFSQLMSAVSGRTYSGVVQLWLQYLQDVLWKEHSHRKHKKKMKRRREENDQKRKKRKEGEGEKQNNK